MAIEEAVQGIRRVLDFHVDIATRRQREPKLRHAGQSKARYSGVTISF